MKNSALKRTPPVNTGFLESKAAAVISLILNALTAVCALWGLIPMLCGSMGLRSMLYFTNQSNTWILIWAGVTAVYKISELTKKPTPPPRAYYIIRLVLSVSITLTGCVFCFVLLPTMDTGLDISMTMLHIVTPVLFVADTLLFERREQVTLRESLWAALPPLYYLAFATVLYFCRVDFGFGRNYPYFFINYGSPAGFFGFSDIPPYFIGSFYWCIIVFAFVFGIAFLYAGVTSGFGKRSKDR